VDDTGGITGELGVPHDPSDADTLDAQRRLVEGMLRSGDPLRAFDEIGRARDRFPEDLRLRQLEGLALARSGAAERAQRVFEALEAEGHRDGETLGMLARAHKQQAFETSDEAERTRHLEAAFDHYERAHRLSKSDADADATVYTGTNAATLASIRGQSDAIADLCRSVRAAAARVLDQRPDAARAYWIHASLGEIALLQGEREEATREYGRAADLAGDRFADRATTLVQARRLLAHRGEPSAWVDALLQVRPIAALIQGGAAAPPESAYGPLRDRIRELYDRLRPSAVYGSGSPGADLLFLDEARRREIEIHLTLPYPADEFRSAHYAGRPGDAERFDLLLASAASLTLASDHRAEHSAASLTYAQQFQLGLAALRARALSTRLVPVLLRDRDSQELNPEALRRSELLGVGRSGLAFLDTPLAPPDRRTPPRAESPEPAENFEHRLVAMVFADAVGYSRLSENQIPRFVEHFLGSIAALIRGLPEAPLLTETMGDGLYAVYAEASEAARFALQMSELVAGRDWTRQGLPPDLDLRVGLHCGPVFSCIDPISGLHKFTGPHTSRTARIEPVTPPGHVYASQAFAAVAAARGVEELRFEYVGRTPLAKKYGTLPLYHVRRSRLG